MTADYILAPNPSGLEMRTEINAIFSAILSQNSSATEPTSTVAGMFWYDTTTSIFKQRNSTNDGWVDKWDTSKGMLASLASPTFTGNVNMPSTSYIAGNLIASLASPTFTGTVTIPNLMVNTAVSLPAATSIGSVSQTEISYLDGVTSAIQTQLNGKQATLVSGTNIKTVNGTTLLGTGNIEILSNITGVFANSQEITSSGTFTVPDGITKVMVLMASGGGGGGGGKAVNGGTSASGGGGGASVFAPPQVVTVTPLSDVIVTIGAGGNGGAGLAYNQAYTVGNGGKGGSTSFGSITVEGANGGYGANNTATGGNGGANSAGVIREVNSTAGSNGLPSHGGYGATCSTGGNTGTGTAGGIGGTSNVNNGSNGVAGVNGWGGAGGAGGTGKVVVYW